MALHFTSLHHHLSVHRDNFADDMHLSERRWFAVRTASKHEKSAVKELTRLGIEAYIPLRQKTYNYTSKKVIRELPLLSGYVFVHVCRAEEHTVRFSHYVSRFVTIGKQRKRVTEEEMSLLKKISTDRELDWLTVEDAFDFSEGTPVEIIRGPLAGVRGIYLNKKNKKTFVIALGSLDACLATCEVDPTFLVALDGARPLVDVVSDKGNEGKKSLW